MPRMSGSKVACSPPSRSLSTPRVLALEHDLVDSWPGRRSVSPGPRPAPSSASAGRSARCACRGCRRPATCRRSAPRRRGTARSVESRPLECPSSSAGASEPSWRASPGSTTWPFATSGRVRRGSWYSFGWSGSPSSSTPSGSIVTFGAAVGLLDLDPAADPRERRRALRVAGLEDLDDAREAVRDVRAGDAAGVERPHRQLRTRLADRLRGDDADSVADLADLAGGEEGAVTLRQTPYSLRHLRTQRTGT